jgi:hypothetical protein
VSALKFSDLDAEATGSWALNFTVKCLNTGRLRH